MDNPLIEIGKFLLESATDLSMGRRDPWIGARAKVRVDVYSAMLKLWNVVELIIDDEYEGEVNIEEKQELKQALDTFSTDLHTIWEAMEFDKDYSGSGLSEVIIETIGVWIHKGVSHRVDAKREANDEFQEFWTEFFQLRREEEIQPEKPSQKKRSIIWISDKITSQIKSSLEKDFKENRIMMQNYEGNPDIIKILKNEFTDDDEFFTNDEAGEISRAMGEELSPEALKVLVELLDKELTPEKIHDFSPELKAAIKIKTGLFLWLSKCYEEMLAFAITKFGLQEAEKKPLKQILIDYPDLRDRIKAGFCEPGAGNFYANEICFKPEWVNQDHPELLERYLKRFIQLCKDIVSNTETLTEELQGNLHELGYRTINGLKMTLISEAAINMYYSFRQIITSRMYSELNENYLQEISDLPEVAATILKTDVVFPLRKQLESLALGQYYQIIISEVNSILSGSSNDFKMIMSVMKGEEEKCPTGQKLLLSLADPNNKPSAALELELKTIEEEYISKMDDLFNKGLRDLSEEKLHDHEFKNYYSISDEWVNKELPVLIKKWKQHLQFHIENLPIDIDKNPEAPLSSSFLAEQLVWGLIANHSMYMDRETNEKFISSLSGLNQVGESQEEINDGQRRLGEDASININGFVSENVKLHFEGKENELGVKKGGIKRPASIRDFIDGNVPFALLEIRKFAIYTSNRRKIDIDLARTIFYSIVNEEKTKSIRTSNKAGDLPLEISTNVGNALKEPLEKIIMERLSAILKKKYGEEVIDELFDEDNVSKETKLKKVLDDFRINILKVLARSRTDY